MTDHLFNRSIFLWAGAIILAFFIVNPREALIQRVNTMDAHFIDCLRQDSCTDQRELTQARLYYQILAQLYPDYGRGFEMQGICYLLLKQDKWAISKFREAIKHNPDLFWASFELGKAFYRQGDYPQALKYFQSIIEQDNNTLLKKATLSSLRQLSDQTRRTLIIGLVDFVADIKLKSYQMAVGCYVHQGDLAGAQGMVSQGSQQFKENEFFDLAKRSLDENDPRLGMLAWIDALAYSKPAFHPWGQVIQPMKEVLYQ